MNKKQNKKDEADRTVRNIKRATRHKFNAEEKIRSFWLDCAARPFITGMTGIYLAALHRHGRFRRLGRT